MNQLFKGVGLAALIVATAACEQTAKNGNNDPDPGNPTATTYDDYAAEALIMAVYWATIDATDPSTLPTNGSATYDGIVNAVASENGNPAMSLAGDLSMTFDFSSNSDPISGSLSDVADSNGVQYGGSVDILGGFVDRTADPATENVFGAAMQGTLIDGNDNDVQFVGTLGGDFIGAGHEAANGDVDGSMVSSDGFFTVDGQFYSER